MTDLDIPPGLAHPQHAETLEDILRLVAEHNAAPDLEMVRDAFRLARYVHAFQERKSDRQPYIVHPLAVAQTCAEQRMDDISVAAAILHDCIEDVDATFDLRPVFMAEHLGPLLAGIIEDLLSSVPGEGLSRAEPDSEQLKPLIHAAVALRFGPEVVRITEGLTKLRSREVSPASDAELETLKKLLKATASEDIRTIIIKIFDRCDNIRTIDVFRPEKQRRIAEKTLLFYVPIATRLGFFNEAREMEDHVMRVLQPELYRVVTTWLRTADRRIRWRVERDVKAIRTELEARGIRCRSKLYAKGIFSIWQGLPTKEHIRRRIGDGCNFNLLLVVDDEDACFRTLNLVHGKFPHLPARVRDFINNPKVNGYQSIHTICTGHKLPKIQVLIRTESMDLENHLGVISRLRGGELDDSEWIAELVESFQALGMDELLRLSRAVAFPEIDVFTPHGEPRKLPEGATALDFAYDIHTEVGDHARVAVIDGRMRSLGTVLRSGQRIEIVTSGEVRPTYPWFGKVTTAKATIAIRKALKRLEEDDGEAEVLRFLRFCNRKLHVKLNPKSRSFHQFLGHLGLASVIELGRELMAGRTDYDHLLPALVETLPQDSFEPLIEGLAEQGLLDDGELEITGEFDEDDTVRSAIHEAVAEHVRMDEPPEMSIEIEGLRHRLPTRIARCCRPAYGDEIIAYTSRGRGASIHRRDCKAVLRMVEQGSAHVSPARWSRRPDKQLMRYDIVGTDRRGLFLSVSGKLADMGVDAQAIKLKAEPDGTARGYARVEVDDLTDREEIAARLRAVPGVTSVVIRDPGVAPHRGVTYDDE
jgi:GTP diphosphokinase / guanosine-3',5'-bis(diphosphate) 3'-diphosphatase